MLSIDSTINLPIIRSKHAASPMLYVVEMDFTQPARQAQWDAWYLEHLDALLSVPGFHTAQRFLCLTPWPAPYLAIYTVDAPEVFASAAYRERGGRDSTGEWKPSMVNWDRNLFAGLERAPAVATDQLLLLTEAEPAAVAGSGLAFSWLTVAGLDRTVARRGLAVAADAQARRAADGSGGLIRAYRPLLPQRLAARGTGATRAGSGTGTG